MIIVIILDFVAVIAWCLVVGWHIGEAIKRRKRKKFAQENTKLADRLRCYICGGYDCQIPISREEYYRAVAERTKKARLRRNRTW